MFLWLLKTLQQRYFLFLFQFFDVRQIRILWTLLNWQNEQFTSQVQLYFSVSHIKLTWQELMASLLSPYHVTLNIWYTFLSSFFAGALFHFFAEIYSYEIV